MAPPQVKEGSTYIETTFYVTQVYRAKYSKVIGYIKYKDIMLYTDNGNTGYHSKEYNLKPGDKIPVKLFVNREPYRRGVYLWATDIDVSQYER